jgi:trk system potassium uptake protein TrkH
VRVPAVVAAAGGNTGVALRYLAVILLFSCYGALTARLRVAANIQRYEALVITALVFSLSACALSFPLTGCGIPFADTCFEAVSGVTMTGFSTLASVEDRPASFLSARAWI